MTKTRVTVPVLLALCATVAAGTHAYGQMPGAYPTTGSPAYSVASANTVYPPTTAQAPVTPYSAPYGTWQQPTYGTYTPANYQPQVACNSAPCAPAAGSACGCTGMDNPYMQPSDCQPYMQGCGDTSCMPCQPGAMWCASVGGLLMSIDEGHHYFFSYDDANEDQQYTDWRNVNMEWGGGFEVALRRFGACSCSGWEILYWGLYPGTETTTTYDGDLPPGSNLNGILNFGNLYITAPGDLASDYVNNAQFHRLSRDVEIHNAEINHVMMTAGSCDSCCTPWRSEVLCGVRFLKYDDNLQFMADTAANPPLYYDIDCENTLVGFQLGGYGEYGFGSRWAVGAGAKVGVFNNHISSYSRIGTSGTTATIGDGPNQGRAWLVDASKDDVSMLGEFNVDLVCQITPCWYGSLGYRVVGVTGVATPTDQIYHDLRGINDVELVDSHGSLFLHGFSASVERRF